MYEYPMPINADKHDDFCAWFDGLPAGKYRASDLRKSLNDYLTTSGYSEISAIQFSKWFVRSGGISTRDSEGRIFEKVFTSQEDTEV